MEKRKMKKIYATRNWDAEMLKSFDIQSNWDITDESGDVQDFDEIGFYEFIDDMIKDYDNYLIIAYSSNWLRQTGYKLESEKTDIFNRSYECSQYVVGGSVGGKVLKIREYHHDCPTGHDTVIIGLTDKEYEKITLADYFETVESFAMSFNDKIKEI